MFNNTYWYPKEKITKWNKISKMKLKELIINGKKTNKQNYTHTFKYILCTLTIYIYYLWINNMHHSMNWCSGQVSSSMKINRRDQDADAQNVHTNSS